MSAVRTDVVTVLLRRRVISGEQLAEARDAQARSGLPLEDLLVRLGHVTTREVMLAWAESLGVGFLDLTGGLVPVEVIELVPESVARENCVLPVALEGGTLTVALGDPSDPDTVPKLQFILNREVRPVLAPRQQVIDAINFYYGRAETESVESMLVEFTDTAIDFTETEGVAAGVGEQSAPAPLGPGAPLDRRATVRYYHRMNPEQMFPLLVVLSEKSIREVSKRGVSQGESRAFRVAEGSLVEVEPVLPGCCCYPPKEQVRVGAGEATVHFWVVPHVLGKLAGARVVVRQGGGTLAEVPLQVRVVKQSLTVLAGGLSLVLPLLLIVLKHLRLDLESQLQEGFGLYARLLGWLLRSLTPECLAGLLLAGTACLYLWLRPRKRDVFWDVTVDPAGAEVEAEGPRLPEEAGAVGTGAVGEESRGSLLDLADRCYRSRDYAGALGFYERAGVTGVRAADYFRASLAAFRCGDVGRALAVLRQAEASLPASEMTGPMWYNMGCFATRLGRFAEALRYLNRAVDAGYDDPEQYRRDPDLSPLRWHAGFKSLLGELGWKREGRSPGVGVRR